MVVAVVMVVVMVVVGGGGAGSGGVALAGGARPLVARKVPLELGEVEPGRADGRGVARWRAQAAHRGALPALRHLAQTLDLQLVGRLQERLQSRGESLSALSRVDETFCVAPRGFTKGGCFVSILKKSRSRR